MVQVAQGGEWVIKMMMEVVKAYTVQPLTYATTSSSPFCHQCHHLPLIILPSSLSLTSLSIGPGFLALAPSSDSEAPLVRNTGIDIGGYEAPRMIPPIHSVSFACL